jgi:chromosome segregation protein
VLAAEEALATAQQHARDAVAFRDELSAKRDSLRESLAGTRDRVSQTTYKIDSLRTLLASLEAQDEDVRRAILELIPSAFAAAEAVHAAVGFEAALDTLLREVSKAVVVETSETAAEAIRRLRERGAGRGAFVTLDYAPTGEGTRRGDAAYAVVGEGPIANAIRLAIPEAYIVGSLGEAIERSKDRPHATFVTLEGDIVRGPLVIGGKTEGATPGVFSIKREIADLEALVGTEETRASGIAAELQMLEEDLRSADDARILAEERARAAEQELRDRRNQRERAGAELQRFEKDLAVASEEEMLYAEEKDQLLGRKHTAIAELEQLESRERELHESIRVHEEELAVARTAFEEVTEVASKARVDVESAAGNVNAIQREHENLSRIVISLGSRVTQLQQEIEMLLRRQQETEVAVEDARGQLDR